MAASPRNPTTRRRALLALLLAAPLAASGVAAPQAAAAKAGKPRDGEIVLDAASSEVDYRSDTLLFRDVVITQGAVRGRAERAHATGLDFKAATWTFSGKVRITVQDGELRSEEAVVTFVADRVTRAVVRGQQAEFEQKLKDGGKARGRAASLTYETAAAKVTLRGDASLSDGRSDIRGEQLVYDINAQRVQAGKASGSDERVRIVIRPQGTP
ncbi:MAG: lipopolysaccharide transport periplasmic protein LptA [Gammaproteobacteria bacterium]